MSTRMGRPPAQIDLAKAVELLKNHPATRVSRILGVHRNTLYRHLNDTMRFVEADSGEIESDFGRLAQQQETVISPQIARPSVTEILTGYYDRKIQERELRKRKERECPRRIGRPSLPIDTNRVNKLLQTKPTHDVAEILGCHRNTLLRHLSLAGLNRGITGLRPGVLYPSMRRLEHTELSYPYLVTTEGDGSELIIQINNLISRSLPANVRADICQDMILAILAGEISLGDIKTQAGYFIRQHFQQFPTRYAPLSLDHPFPGDPDGRPLKDMIRM